MKHSFAWLAAVPVLLFFCGCPQSPSDGGQTSLSSGSKAVDVAESGSSGNVKVDVGASDDQLISSMRAISENCNASVFHESSVERLVLDLEWNKIQSRVSDLYHQAWPDRPRPKGMFLTTHESFETKQRDFGFYSHNQHFQWLVGKALMGDNPRFTKITRGMGSFLRPLHALNSRYQQNGTNYQAIADDVKKILADPFQGVNCTAQVDQSNNSAKVLTDWRDIQSIGDHKYQFRVQVDCYESSGGVMTSQSHWREVDYCFRAEVKCQVRCQEEPGKVCSVGPFLSTMLGKRADAQAVSDSIGNLSVDMEGSLNSSNLDESTFESAPDEEYAKGVMSSLKNSDVYNDIADISNAIDEQLSQ